MRPASRLAHFATGRSVQGPISAPIVQTATFPHASLEAQSQWKYSRFANPTRAALEEGLADLEGGHRAFAFASGMAALTAVFHLFRPGDHLVVTEDLYGVTWRILDQLFGPLGIRYTFVDTTDLDAVRAALRPETAGLFVETVTNPLLKVADIPALAALARAHGARLIVDNTFLSPYLHRPLEHGAHVVVHSASKYLAGHNDVIAGAVIVKSPPLAEELGFLHGCTGAVLGPQDCYLTIRGLKTLALRMERAQANALRLAEWLRAHPLVDKVYYPGLPDNPYHATLARQAAGGGAMLSFELKDPALVGPMLARFRLAVFAESLGGTETLVTFPWTQTHNDMPPQERRRLGISDRLVRVSAGIEDAEDLIADFAQALVAEV